MEINKLSIAYFSPTLSTRRLALHVAWGLGFRIPTQQINLTSVKERQIERRMGSDELLIFAAPCYGGRLPHLSPTLLENLQGNDTPAISLVVYGNRGYDDSLVETSDELTKAGFVVVGSAALIAEHANSTKVGTGRPDAHDIQETSDFGHALRKKLDEISVNQIANYTVKDLPGNRPYKDLPAMPGVSPSTTDKCVLCMLCHRWCPMGAIKYNDPNITDADKCILCQACVKRCPTDARVLENESINARVAGMEQAFAAVYHNIETYL